MQWILVIDDDVQMRGFVSELLTRNAYQVLTAVEGRHGIEIFKRNPIDLVITDLFMPEKEGCETIMELIGRSPDTKIIAISGGSRDGRDCLSIARKLGATRTLSKPIRSEELLKAVREVLGDSSMVAAQG
jgi:DNA-binding response OmpR family regulator